MKLQRNPLFIVLATAFLLSLAGAPQAREDEMSAKDFIDDASAMNNGELTAAGIALEKEDASEDVRKFAKKLQEDHQALETKLEELARQYDTELSTLSDAESMAAAAKLKVMSGASFDADFAEAQVNAHQNFIQFMEKASDQLKDEALRTFASDQLPVLREHMEMAKQLQTAHPQD